MKKFTFYHPERPTIVGVGQHWGNRHLCTLFIKSHQVIDRYSYNDMMLRTEEILGFMPIVHF